MSRHRNVATALVEREKENQIMLSKREIRERLAGPGVEERMAAMFAEELSAAAPRRTGYVTVKRLLEWLLALCLVVGTSPLVLMLAAVVRLNSHGPAFYSQTRLGRNGRRYRVFKLRTMVHDAEAQTGPVWAAKNDCRITRVGKFLRNTHLDELPQLWNVVRGEMSLIGPRPERPEIADQLERELPAYRGRLQLNPGITGLAQMLVGADDPNVPPAVSVKRKLAHDLFYVREVSLWLDLRIAVATPCYFLAAAVESIHDQLMKPYGAAVEREMTVVVEERESAGVGREVLNGAQGTW